LKVKDGRIWAPFTKGETKQGHSARTSKGLVTREDRAVHERGRTFGRHSPRVKPSKGAVRERQKGWSPAKTALRTNEEEFLESGIEEGDLDERWSISCKGVLNPWCSGFHEMRATRAPSSE